ncbi:hypothetical protein FB390_4965 [Nocardia bhagyanarayanae]|uniref:Uncharacterized protein n=1 Tax=Nocardia bhagyanarayanae TaxID=1215925 RepID=A0A543FHJ5_9NOCA|nr:hypothetical protein FB390_4965 [Nocardia bhagyanarayanae]
MPTLAAPRQRSDHRYRGVQRSLPLRGAKDFAVAPGPDLLSYDHYLMSLSGVL